MARVKTVGKRCRGSRLFTALMAAVLACGLMLPSTPAVAEQQNAPGTASASAESTRDLDAIIAGMTLDEKLSQMIVPSIRTWDGEALTSLSAAPELARVLQSHQYGGVILFDQNIVDVEQTVRLVSELQANNAAIEGVSTSVPYFIAADEEGGVVVRLPFSPRMNGNMAVRATGPNAKRNAHATGKVLGEELAAVGINVDFAPVVDVNSNPANPVIGVRAFSDDPSSTAALGVAYADGLAESNVVAAFKHYPGHGDTGVDSHVDLPSVDKSLDELESFELMPFKTAIESGAEMIMTAQITYPGIQPEVVLGDGVTQGYYPATMSETMVQDILRDRLGYDGIVITDALEMGAIADTALVAGEPGSVEYSVNVTEKVIGAGVDMLLVPIDLNGSDAAAFYDAYIDALIAKVEDGSIDESRIDESVKRILLVKQKHGILDLDTSGDNVDKAVADALLVVGSAEHHAVERDIARQAVTLVKNEGQVLPLACEGKRIVLLGKQSDDCMTIAYAVAQLQEQGVIGADVRVINRAAGEWDDEQAQGGTITIDYSYDIQSDAVHYPDDLQQAVAQADVVLCFSETYDANSLAAGSAQYQSVQRALESAHGAGAKFVLLSDNLPYDAARYQDADAILLAYLGYGLDIDPTTRLSGAGTPVGYNANVVAALEIAFGAASPSGTLPVDVPAIVENGDGTVGFSDTLLYERGWGLRYPNAAGEGDAPSENRAGSTPSESATPASQSSQAQPAVAENQTESTTQQGNSESSGAMPIAIPITVGVLIIAAVVAIAVRRRKYE